VNFFFVDAESTNTFSCGYRGADNFGAFEKMKWDERPLEASCRDCDWECFRDPSELLGLFIQAFTEPRKLVVNSGRTGPTRQSS